MVDISQGSALGPSGPSELFQYLRDGRPRTRAELAALSGLGRSTIATRLDVLLELGLVAPVGGAVSTGGRPPAQVALDASARVVLAADLGASHATVALSDLMGEILVRRSANLDIADGPHAVLSWLVDQTHQLLRDAGRSANDLIAVGIGLPGPVEHSTGQPRNPPIMPGWDAFDVPGHLQQEFDVPVLVDNDVNIMALGEQATAWPTTDHLIFVKVATGIGSGVISGGMLQRGAAGVAGDIGHVQVPHRTDTTCRCGNIGCLEAIASGPAVTRRLREAGVMVHSNSELVELVRSGDVTATRELREAGREIGYVLAMCVSLVNPEVIVLGGSVANAGEHLIAGVREVVYSRSTPLATEHLSIVPSRAGDDAAIIGAAMLAIHHALSPRGVDVLVGVGA